MSDPSLDELAEAARNRGLKLVRSRVRTPTKRRFGKVGLVDKAGKPVFGMDLKGPIAKPEAVEDYLRALNTKDWGASLEGKIVSRRDEKTAAPRTQGNSRAKAAKAPRAAAPPPPPPIPPKPQIRNAKPGDSGRLAELIRYLGHPIEEKEVRRNLLALKKRGESPLVATIGKKVVGLCGIGKRVVISRPAPLGRITSLVVAAETQGQGIGRMLVEAAEAWMEKEGCKLVEVTSNDRRTEAHAFYRHLGYERTSIRFAKKLD